MSFPFLEPENNHDDGTNLLDEFLDQRVYETTPIDEHKGDLMNENLGFDLDINMYNTSPEWESATQTAFHSPVESFYSTGNMLIPNGAGVTPPNVDSSNNNPMFNKPANSNPHTPAGRSKSFIPARNITHGNNPTNTNNNNMNNNGNNITNHDNQRLKMNNGNDLFKKEPLSPHMVELGNGNGNTNKSMNNEPLSIPTSSDIEVNGISNSNNDTDYDYARSCLSKLKFGNPTMKSCPENTEPDPSYLDFSESAMATLPYKLKISNVPHYLRVETQIKLRISMSPSPSQYLLHIPQDVISKNKFCLQDPIESINQQLGDKLLYLDVFVMTSNLQRSCTICTRCIRREQKRALRRKSGAYEEDESLKNNTLWSDENMSKKAIIFNCKEIVSFPSPNGLMDDHKLMELSARIVCYCRHHLELSGFKLLFVVKNHLGNVVAREISTPIMIMDRKKTPTLAQSTQSMNESNEADSSSASLIPNSLKQQETSDFNNTSQQLTPNDSMLHPISPNSIDDLSEPTNTDTNDERSLKRKKLSVDDSLNALNLVFNINFLPLSNSDTNASTHNYYGKPGFAQNSLQPQPQQHQIRQGPTIQRIIPAEGPIRGGIAVTILGCNFRQGLSVKFGSNQALATHCWSDTTIVTYLPPASQPGQVLVSFEGENMIPDQELIFTYTDDTDRQLIELALQIVGLKMNGKLEDAKNIARRIVGTDGGSSGSNMSNNEVGSNSNGGGQTRNANVHTNQVSVSNSESQLWFEEVQRTAKELSRSDISSEDLLILFLSLVDLPNCPLTFLNWLLPNAQGQLLLHLATLKNYQNLVKFLITRGSKVDTLDNLGLSPLFYAALCGHRDLINGFLDCRANYNLKLSNDLRLTDYCDLNVMDIFLELSEIEEVGGTFNKSKSVDSLYLMFAKTYGRHVLKMVNEFDDKDLQPELPNDVLEGYDEESEFADSEGESEGDYEDNNDYSEIAKLNASGAVGKQIEGEIESTDQEEHGGASSNNSIWQRFKNVLSNDSDDVELPSYDDLFPFGHTAKPQVLDLEPTTTSAASEKMREAGVVEIRSGMGSSSIEEDGITSDSSDDIVFSRKFLEKKKPVKNDKMLLFFWFPVLITVLLLLILSSFGHNFEFIESIKDSVRVTIGNMMLGNERLIRVFKPKADQMITGTT